MCNQWGDLDCIVCQWLMKLHPLVLRFPDLLLISDEEGFSFFGLVFLSDLALSLEAMWMTVLALLAGKLAFHHVGGTCVGCRAAPDWLLAALFSEWQLSNESPWEPDGRPVLQHGCRQVGLHLPSCSCNTSASCGSCRVGGVASKGGVKGQRIVHGTHAAVLAARAGFTCV